MSKEMQGGVNRPKHCPECLERGEKRKVKTFQINLEGEAVIMCDLETCSWPFKTERRESYMVTLTKEEMMGKKKKKQKA